MEDVHKRDHSFLCAFPVDGVPLGQYLHRYPNTNVSALINKTRDTEDVRRIKQVLAAMLAPAAANRPTMEQVVEQLSHLHNTLCMKVLLTYNTAWESPRLLSKCRSMSLTHALHIRIENQLPHSCIMNWYLFSKQTSTIFRVGR
jgi:hypothetical protein